MKMEMTNLSSIVRHTADRARLFAGTPEDLGALDRALRQIVEEHLSVPEPLRALGLTAKIEDADGLDESARLSRRADVALSPDGFMDEGLAVLRRVAEALDSLARPPWNSIGFVADQWIPLADGRLLVDWPALAALGRAGATQGLTQAQKRHRAHLHPSLTRATNGETVEPQVAMVHSFARFLLDRLAIPRTDVGTLSRNLEHLRTLLPWLPPAVPDLLHRALSGPPNGGTNPCASLLEAIDAEMRNMLTLASRNHAPSRRLVHRADSYSIGGLHKSGPNEDRELGPFETHGVTFVGVADGVSTCDLGSGATAADIARRVFEQRRSHLAETFGSGSNGEKFVDSARRWLRDSIDAVLAEIVRRTNSQLAGEDPARHSDPMSCTLVAALVHGDTAAVAWVGDALALRHRASNGRMVRLTIPQNSHADLLRAGGLELRHLGTADAPAVRTHALGGGEWIDKEGFYRLVSAEPDFGVFRFEEGDTMVLGSDGLLDCLEDRSEFARVERLAAALEASRADRTNSPRHIAATLVRLGEAEASNDNITAQVVLFERREEPKSRAPKRSKVKTCPKK